MAGDHELLRLAQLLKLCGDLARSIAAARDDDDDSARIHALSRQTTEIAHQLEELILRSGTRDKASDTLDRRH